MNSFWPKCTSGNVCGSQVAELALFLQQEGVFVNEEVWDVVQSCFRSVRVCERCLQSLLWLVVTGMRDWSCFAILLVFEVSKLKSLCRPVYLLYLCCTSCS